jgi:RNA polymerase primary sigma factor
MARIDPSDKLKILKAKAKQKGFVTVDEILAAYPEPEENIKVIEELIGQGVTIHDDEKEKTSAKDKKKAELPVEESHDNKEDIPTALEQEAWEKYRKEIKKTKLLTAKEEKNLAIKMKEGDVDARHKLIKANQRLVMHIARRFKGQGVALADLVQEGNKGLIKAIERFDPAREGKISTYATWWIKKYIATALAEQSRSLRLPIKYLDLVKKMKLVTSKLTQELGRQPRVAEIAEALERDPAEIDEVIAATQSALSLYTPVMTDDEEVNLMDLLADLKAVDPEEYADDALARDFIDKLSETLTPKEKTLVYMRYGLSADGIVHTLEEIGTIFGLTKERVRQMEEEALEKMRKQMKKTKGSAEFKPAPKRKAGQ